MQLTILDDPKRPYGTFSILGRIGGDATPPGAGDTTLLLCLSVSSVGSEAMQRGMTWTPKAGEGSFQYPRSDRRRCNLGDDVCAGDGEGTFQYPRSDRRRCNGIQTNASADDLLAFSILGRIGGDATT